MRIITKELDHLIGTIAEAKSRILLLMAGPAVYDKAEVERIVAIMRSAREQAETLEPSFREAKQAGDRITFQRVPRHLLIEVVAGEKAADRLLRHEKKTCKGLIDESAPCTCRPS
jgi:hypothetical protein